MAASEAETGQPRAATGIWTVDSGASHHLCNDRDQLFAVEPALLSVKVANGNRIAAMEKGSTIIDTYSNGERRTVLLRDVYYAKGVDRNLISVAQLTKRGYSCEFSNKCTIRSKSGKVIAEVERSPVDGLWSAGIEEGAASFASMTTSTLQQWHERLGHLNFQDLTRMLDKKLVHGMVMSNRKIDFCMSCAEAKQTRRAKNKQDTSASAPTDEPGATLCVDLKTDMEPDRVGHKHMLTIVDHATNYNRVYLLRKKCDADLSANLNASSIRR
ncbi:unnamed protein product [Phytophthora fragariaefolia]|uniref:Unnamed protein product n=1 Tax=Phytophthora fragariaefolia TaxID=1490495 RepID=A0A9W6YET9_9STRA|nr:unnamed protein product [Phytophthora fragariaefolia]